MDMLFGPAGSVEVGPFPDGDAVRLLARGGPELVRALAAAARRPEQRSSALWQVAVGFHQLTRKQQSDLVSQTIKGFAALDPEEQADILADLAPRLRAARKGVKKGHFLPLVTKRGREEAHPDVAALLDSLEASLRRLSESERRRLHRRLDRAVSEALTPMVLARILAKLPPNEVDALEAWVVAEGALSPEATKLLFLALTQAAQPGDALFSALQEEFSEANVDSFWSGWLRGEASLTSPRSRAGSVAGDADYADWTSRIQRRLSAPAAVSCQSQSEKRSGRPHSKSLAQLPAGSSGRVSLAGLAPVSPVPRATVCQLHCPAEVFLCSAPAKPQSTSLQAMQRLRAARVFATLLACVKANYRLNVLHTNDHHSHLTGESATLRSSSTGFAGGDIRVSYGGYPRMVTAYAQLQAEAEAMGHGVVKLHAGDAITGTSFYSLFRGQADAHMMAYLCFDAFELGNHEFDDGDANLANFIDTLDQFIVDVNGTGTNNSICHGTPVLAANVVPGPTSPLIGKLHKSTIVESMGEMIGIVGIDVKSKTMLSSSPSAGTTLTDERTAAQAEINKLTAMGVNKIVLLTHVGYDVDTSQMAQLSGVDIVIGGDSHSLLGNSDTTAVGWSVQGAYPTEVSNVDGKKVCVGQAWEYTKAIGHLQVEFDSAGDVVSCGGMPRFAYDASTLSQAANDYLATLGGQWMAVEADMPSGMALAEYEANITRLRTEQIATVPEKLCFDRFPGQGRGSCPKNETRDNGGAACQVVSMAFMTVTPTADASIQNGGGCRTDIEEGSFTHDDAYTMLPFSNTLVLLTLTGQQIKQVLEEAVEYGLDPGGSTGSYPYSAGLRWTLDASQPMGMRFTSIEINSRLAGTWSPLQDSMNYSIVTNSYIAGGRDGYTTFTSASDSVNTYIEYAEGLVIYAKQVQTLVAPAVASWSTQSYTMPPFRLTVLHTNDHHSHLGDETLTISDSFSFGSDVRLSYGGYPRMVTAYRQFKSTAESSGRQVIKLHAGDAMTGTTYYSLFRGRPDALMMAHLCFDAFELGNHEFDDGDANLANFIDMLNNHTSLCAKTPVLAANVVPGPGSPITNKIQKSTTIEKGGEMIGVVGIDVRTKTMRSSSPSHGTTLTDEATAAQAEIDSLMAQGVNKIVLLTHVGYGVDVSTMAKLNGVDIVIGGDSHSLLGDGNTTTGTGITPAGSYPTETTNGDGKKVCVVQAWEYTKAIGHLMVDFNEAGDVLSCGGMPQFVYDDTSMVLRTTSGALSKSQMSTVLTWLQGLGGQWVAAAKNAATQADLATYEDQVATLRNESIATVPTKICFSRLPGDGRTCPAADTLPHGGGACQVVSMAFMNVTKTADMAIQNAGGCRTLIEAGDFTHDDAYTMLPFSNTLVTLELTGQQVINSLEDALDYIETGGSSGAYPYAAGLRFDVDRYQAKGSRFTNVQVKPRLEGTWTAISLSTKYIVVTNSYISGGRDGYDTFLQASSTVNTFTEYAEGLVRYAKDVGTLVQPPYSEFSTQSWATSAATTMEPTTTMAASMDSTYAVGTLSLVVSDPATFASSDKVKNEVCPQGIAAGIENVTASQVTCHSITADRRRRLSEGRQLSGSVTVDYSINYGVVDQSTIDTSVITAASTGIKDGITAALASSNDASLTSLVVTGVTVNTPTVQSSPPTTMPMGPTTTLLTVNGARTTHQATVMVIMATAFAMVGH